MEEGDGERSEALKSALLLLPEYEKYIGKYASSFNIETSPSGTDWVQIASLTTG